MVTPVALEEKLRFALCEVVVVRATLFIGRKHS